jgi:hypothetical protein
LDASLGAELADLDLALCLRELGLRTECEPTSLYVDLRVVRNGASFRQGYAAQRCFLRHLDPATRREAMPNHALRLVGELALCLVQPWWLAHLVGRACGLVASKFESSHASRMAKAQARLTAESEAGTNILRMPTHGRGTESPLQQRRAA